MRNERYYSPLGGLFLIGLGVFFLVGQFMSGWFWHFMWPAILLGLGMLFFVGMLIGGRDGETGGLAIPGSILTTLGLIFFFQVITNHWASWAYMWTLLAPTSVGVGLILFGWWNHRPQLFPAGLILIGIGLCLFVLLGGFFELLIGIAGFHTPGRILWPLMIILLGVFLLVQRGLRGMFWSGPHGWRHSIYAAPVPGENETKDHSAA
jgi:hypothetical protein